MVIVSAIVEILKETLMESANVLKIIIESMVFAVFALKTIFGIQIITTVSQIINLTNVSMERYGMDSRVFAQMASNK